MNKNPIKKVTYGSLSVCLIDSIYSVMNNYSSCKNIISRYADKYMDGDNTKTGNNLSNLIENINDAGGAINFGRDVLCSSKKVGSTGLYRTEVIYRLAKHLLNLGIDTIEDFMNFENKTCLEKEMMAVEGMGKQSSSYLIMLAGDACRSK